MYGKTIHTVDVQKKRPSCKMVYFFRYLMSSFAYTPPSPPPPRPKTPFTHVRYLYSDI